MSRISNRVATIGAVLVIVLLVILLVILWSDVRNVDKIESLGRIRKNLTVDPVVNETRKQVGGLHIATTDLVTTFESIEQNLTNEVLPERIQKTKEFNSTASINVLPLAKGNLEYVKPLKISQNQYEDPPEQFSTAKRHHSGHFRHATAEVWDPHPQYEFTAFGRRFRLRLAHDASFVSPDIKVTHMSENTTRREHAGHHLGCFYSGSVDGDPSSAVSVSLCHGMTGHMKTSMGNYFIKPTEHWREDDKDSLGSSLQHAIYRVPTAAINLNDDDSNYDAPENDVKSRNCGVIDYDSDDVPSPLTDDSSARRIYVGERSRERRSLTRKTASLERFPREEEERYEQFTELSGHRDFFQRLDYDDRYYSMEREREHQNEDAQDSEMDSDPFVTWRPRRALPREYFIEIMVVADAKMVEYHGTGLVSYILVLMSTVSRIYKDQSIGNPVSIAVMKIVKTEEIFGVKHSGSDGIAAAEMLKRFCQWQKRNNPDEPSPEHHDAALLLTRENLCHNPRQKRCDTLGLAELGRMCSPGSSCAIVQDNGLAAAFTIAHEIGHVLNMPHDDDSKCAGFRNRSGVHNVMSRMLDDNTFPWEWSKCSRHYVTEFLEAGYANCLLDEPSKMMERQNGRLPGEDYSENKQCELVFGQGSRICPHMVSDVCRRLWCTAPLWDHHQQCHTQHMPWADGTPCGVDKWCHRGECVSRRNLEPVHGQWGEWGRYGECSRTCGGGVKRKYRECDNPAPKNGGNYCIGERVKYRSCGTRECPPGSPDFREQQCSKFDNNNFNIQNLARDVKWHAKYTRILPQDRCKLYCQVESNQYYMLRDKVIDGTPCGPDTFHICVNGQCKPAGCDHILNSTADLDTCGVCRGDNATCQRIAGAYNTSVYGYTRVAKIPAGSSYIDIKQHGWLNSHNDSNYLALRIGEDGEYILNGNFMVMHRKVIVHPGVTIEYSGPESVVERLNSSRPTAIDLILEVLSVGNVYPPQITYEYTVPKRILNSYTWLLSDWSTCNRMCQGMKYRKAECRSTEHKEAVPDAYCKNEEKPQEESQMCHAHCTLQWQTTSMSECSNHCGPGVRTVTSRCVQILLDSSHSPRPIPAHACLHIEKPSEHQPCVGPCDDAHWSYNEWNVCSVSCGGGVQLRSAICVDSNERQVRNENCAKQEKHLKRTCNQEACPKWDLGEWSQCSVTCGMGKRHRASWCQVENRVVSRTFCSGTPIVTEACDAGPCHQWHTDWSPCSVTCGEGTSRRKVVCKNADGAPSDGCSIAEKPETLVTCTLKPCLNVVSLPPTTYSTNPSREDSSPQENEIDNNGITFHYKWHVGPYGECSQKCNIGYKSRIVRCISEIGMVAPDYYCDSNQQPIVRTTCNHHPCPVWNTGDWSECDVTCGNGFQHRQVRCQSHDGEILPHKECSDEQPKHVRRCQMESCRSSPKNSRENSLESNIIRKWKMSGWTPCSKSCGTGIQTRRVECTMRRGNHGPEVPVKDEQCIRSKSRKPKSQRLCQRIACDFIWQEGTWSECSADCGKGIQRRAVTCHRVNRYGWIDPTPTEGCPMDQRPVGEQICKLRECSDKYYWTAGPWRKCSHPCGRKGRQIRRLYCHDAIGKKVARFHCPAEYKPLRKHKCNQRKCGPVTCLEIQKRLKATTDGEYPLLIGGRNMTIYCHGMSSAEPREYLTLPAGDSENYAEIYDKRLRNPHTCPFNGQRNDSCNCVSELGTVSGRTMFKRVRIDPATLFIIANDYTFSWTKGMQRVEYGKAGDCYSLVECPQGRFSIDLRGTALGLSSEITWVKETSTSSLAINRINNQRIVGKCGGYCGFCKPRTGLKLDVLPP
ncbi:A disintegrin and metalloproteinase with thrombospondin motifs gon-1 isoform X1 [Mycetomoellerius zeteki]|uniref:A disintegrin and metalloproteinase with thrombospondin motifs gon-1 isoform X1 n=1 Tax=Mycetomoellerius zeteki TaxID=64791 RepID=UPI00084ECF46|nr:PREDICTED: A disintegrin and metalloproteinase with thrombospondin motifs gon-1 isoform X1 [Trachymyrmex zeteki]XP_018310554.1 PREDICTED: A disintegrin and metalloproteinase with thrombospondin motifs gon-1 isoform X1 [Trachymyrmex zeteki]